MKKISLKPMSFRLNDELYSADLYSMYKNDWNCSLLITQCQQSTGKNFEQGILRIEKFYFI